MICGRSLRNDNMMLITKIIELNETGVEIYDWAECVNLPNTGCCFIGRKFLVLVSLDAFLYSMYRTEMIY